MKQTISPNRPPQRHHASHDRLPAWVLAVFAFLTAVSAVILVPSRAEAAPSTDATIAEVRESEETQTTNGAFQTIPEECGTTLNRNVRASVGMVDYRDSSTGLGTQCGEVFRGKSYAYINEWKRTTVRDPNRWYSLGEILNPMATKHQMMYGNEWGLAMAWFREVNEAHDWNIVSHCYMTDREGRFGALYREFWKVNDYPGVRYDQMVVRADIYDEWLDRVVMLYIKINFPPCAINGAA